MLLDNQHMRRVANVIKKRIPDGLSFGVTVWHPDYQSMANYVGNAPRVEVVERFEALSVWMKNQTELPPMHPQLHPATVAIQQEIPAGFSYMLLVWYPGTLVVQLAFNVGRAKSAFMLGAIADRLNNPIKPKPLIVLDSHKMPEA